MTRAARTDTYEHTISGLLSKRSDLMGEGMRLREALAVIGNDIEAIDRVLVSLGYRGDLKGMAPRSNRVVYFHRNELRRWLIDELRKATGPITSRALAEKIISLEGKDMRDRALRNDIVKRVGKSLKLLRRQGVSTSSRDETSQLVWRLV